MKESFAIAALVVSIAANLPYVFETIKGSAKPERISWLLWSLLGATYFVSALFENGAVYFTFGELIGPVIILLLSIKYGVGGNSRFDIISLAVALIAFVLLFNVEGVLISLLLALTVDAIGVILTIRKLKVDPTSESRTFWAMGVVASVLALLSLSEYNVETVLFPVYVLSISAVIFLKSESEQSVELEDVPKAL
ncbi:MAG: hypothetical protein OEY09_11985 [Gammaproteobacteria bacterium]|nr:hypothetical protein [Gammaproteobacteria bacterium]